MLPAGKKARTFLSALEQPPRTADEGKVAGKAEHGGERGMKW